MTKLQMESIAARAAQLAVSTLDAADMQDCMLTGINPRQENYEEYLHQLRTGDTTWLRGWIGQEIADGCREAVEILKMWIRAELRAA